MATEYSSARLLAQRLINKKGRLVRINFPPPETIADPERPWDKTKGAADFIDAKAVFSSSKRKPIEGTAFEVGEEEVLIAAIDVNDREITNKCTITDGTRVLNIHDNDALKPGEELVMFTLYARV